MAQRKAGRTPLVPVGNWQSSWGKTGNKNGGGSYGQEQEQLPVLRVPVPFHGKGEHGPTAVLSKGKHCPSHQ